MIWVRFRFSHVFFSILLGRLFERGKNPSQWKGAWHRLTHVDAAIGAPHIADLQRPGVQIAVQDRQPGVVGQHAVVYGQNDLLVRFDPGHLR